MIECAMYAVVYVSTEAIRFSDQDLISLLEESRSKNLTAEITGLLLFKDGNFMQLLEGRKEAVLSVLAKIKSDSRHRGVRVLMEEEIPHREFSDWSMGFKKLSADTAKEIPGYSDFLNMPLTSDQFSSDPSKSLRFLLIFKKSVL
jgi:hypothetical protein